MGAQDRLKFFLKYLKRTLNITVKEIRDKGSHYELITKDGKKIIFNK